MYIQRELVLPIQMFQILPYSDMSSAPTCDGEGGHLALRAGR